MAEKKRVLQAYIVHSTQSPPAFEDYWIVGVPPNFPLAGRNLTLNRLLLDRDEIAKLKSLLCDQPLSNEYETEDDSDSSEESTGHDITTGDVSISLDDSESEPDESKLLDFQTAQEIRILTELSVKHCMTALDNSVKAICTHLGQRRKRKHITGEREKRPITNSAGSFVATNPKFGTGPGRPLSPNSVRGMFGPRSPPTPPPVKLGLQDIVERVNSLSALNTPVTNKFEAGPVKK